MRLAIPALITFAVCAPAQTVDRPLRAVTDPGVVTTRQAITPAGVSSVFQGRLYGASWDQSGDRLWILHATEIYGLDWRNNKARPAWPRPLNQLAIVQLPARVNALLQTFDSPRRSTERLWYESVSSYYQSTPLDRSSLSICAWFSN